MNANARSGTSKVDSSTGGNPPRSKRSVAALLCAAVLVALSPTVAAAQKSEDVDQVMDAYGTTVKRDAWAYLTMTDPARNYDDQYVPRPWHYRQAKFIGYVRTPDDGVWGGSNFWCCDNTYYIFRTRLWAPRRLVIPLRLEGDDGHSLVVNGRFVTGGGFGAILDHNLVVPARKAVRLEVAGFNATVPWAFRLTRRDTGESITETPGLLVVAPALSHHPG